jgi:hypothetical protein
MRTWPIVIAVSLGVIACGDEFPAPREAKPTAPQENDPAYAIEGVRSWYLIPNAATAGHETMRIVVAPPGGTDFIDAWVGDLRVRRLDVDASGRHHLEVSLADLPAGSHDLLLAANGATTAFARIPFYRSAPYYVVVTTDWDFADPGDAANQYQFRLHQDHPELQMTHFVGPYTFTDPAVSPQRRERLVRWLLDQRNSYADEIGLHIHPYCNFVTSAGVDCITDQSTVYPAGDTSGYTVKLGAYSREDTATLLEHAKTLFQENGLPIPRTFRAGGWTATLDTLAALADTGFVADTSALNWKRIEEWEGSELYRWNMEAWNPIDDTSQPYYPSQTDVLSSTAPTLPILEVPDNGVMIDYVTLEEMNGLFDANWDGQPLAAPRTLMMGFHPAPGFTADEYGRVDGFLDYADQKLANRDLGPVVYITLGNLVAAYPR